MHRSVMPQRQDLAVIDGRWLELSQLFRAVGFRRAVSQEIISSAFLHAVSHPSLLFWFCIISFCFSLLFSPFLFLVIFTSSHRNSLVGRYRGRSVSFSLI